MKTNVLLIEDNLGDVRLTQEAFHSVNSSLTLHVAHDAVEAMSFLTRESDHANAPRPDLILLDLNLPKMDGRTLLALLKRNDSLKVIPTVVLTTSGNPEDISRSYQLHANAYVIKPAQWTSFENLVKSINDFWLMQSRLPKEFEFKMTPLPVRESRG
jgi:two-component system, chemotaxis family, response regulator Rcp1